MQVPSDLKTVVMFDENGFLSENLRSVEWVNVRSIKANSEYQLRDLSDDKGNAVDLDETHVNSIAATLRDKTLDQDFFGSVDRLPLVVRVGKTCEIVSGFHRVAVYRSLKFDQVPVRVFSAPDGTSETNLQAALQLIGLSENEHSGAPLKMSKRDKMKTLQRMLGNPVYQSMSSAQLSKLTGISDKTISGIKKELGVKTDTIITTDGKVRTATAPRKTVEETPAEEAIDESPAPSPRVESPAPEPATAPARSWLDEIPALVDGDEKLVRVIQAMAQSYPGGPIQTVVGMARVLSKQGEIIKDLKAASEAPPAPETKAEENPTYERLKLQIPLLDPAEAPTLQKALKNNWSKFKKKMTPEQIAEIEQLARDRGLTV